VEKTNQLSNVGTFTCVTSKMKVKLTACTFNPSRKKVPYIP